MTDKLDTSININNLLGMDNNEIIRQLENLLIISDDSEIEEISNYLKLLRERKNYRTGASGLNIPVVSACKTMTFSVGDKVRITCRKHGHGFKIGEEVWITEVDSSMEDYETTNNVDTWQVTDEEIVKCR